MSKRFLFFMAVVAALLSTKTSAQDVLHLKSGEVLNCQIEAITDNILTYQVSVDLGGGKTASSRRTISPAVIDYIEFAPLPGEVEALGEPERADRKVLEKLWFDLSRHLHRPRSNAGKVGLAYADALLKSDKEYEWNEALQLFDRIREKDWDETNRQAAFQGRLRSLIQIGDLETALHEANQLAEQSEDPGMLIEARYALAQVDFKSLRKLESENPKWEEDDTVRPDRNRLYHRILDQFLWPYLFHGTEEEAAARGLVAAAETYAFGGDLEAARDSLNDVLALYPNTRQADVAQERMKEFQVKNQTDEKPTN